jgi:hypothetical protein
VSPSPAKKNLLTQRHKATKVSRHPSAHALHKYSHAPQFSVRVERSRGTLQCSRCLHFSRYERDHGSEMMHNASQRSFRRYVPSGLCHVRHMERAAETEAAFFVPLCLCVRFQYPAGTDSSRPPPTMHHDCGQRRGRHPVDPRRLPQRFGPRLAQPFDHLARQATDRGIIERGVEADRLVRGQ